MLKIKCILCTYISIIPQMTLNLHLLVVMVVMTRAMPSWDNKLL